MTDQPLTVDVIIGRIRQHYLPSMEGKTFGSWLSATLETPDQRATLTTKIAELETYFAAKTRAGVVAYAATVPPAPATGPTGQFYLRVTDLAFGEEGSIRGWLLLCCRFLARQPTMHLLTGNLKLHASTFHFHTCVLRSHPWIHSPYA
jgi:hypothetical protein